MSLSDRDVVALIGIYEHNPDLPSFRPQVVECLKELQSLRASKAKVVEALRSLVAKLDECEGPITAVCAMAAVRGFPYRGPNYKAELAAACTTLAEHGGQT